MKDSQLIRRLLPFTDEAAIGNSLEQPVSGRAMKGGNREVTSYSDERKSKATVALILQPHYLFSVGNGDFMLNPSGMRNSSCDG